MMKSRMHQLGFVENWYAVSAGGVEHAHLHPCDSADHVDSGTGRAWIRRDLQREVRDAAKVIACMFAGSELQNVSTS
jgi:hypothetical protein